MLDRRYNSTKTLDGVIDLERLRSGPADCIERNPERFFELTYLSVELDALKYNDDIAQDRIKQIWLDDVFRETHQSVIFHGMEETRSAIQGFSTHGQRYVISPLRLSQEERVALYQGLSFRNQVILLEPRDKRVSHLTNPDLLALVKRLKAARQLAGSTSNTERRVKFGKIEKDQLSQIQRTLKSGYVYVRIDSWGDQPSQAQFEEESLGQAASKDDIRNYLLSQVYTQSLFAEHLRGNLPNLFGRRVEQVDRAYRNTLGYPVPLTVSIVTDTLRNLKEEQRS